MGLLWLFWSIFNPYSINLTGDLSKKNKIPSNNLRSKKINYLCVRVLTYSRSYTSIVLHKIRAYIYALYE